VGIEVRSKVVSRLMDFGSLSVTIGRSSRPFARFGHPLSVVLAEVLHQQVNGAIARSPMS